MSDRGVMLRDAWRVVEYEKAKRELAEHDAWFADLSPRTLLLLQLRRIDAERARVLALIEETTP